jgi:hypothetical protein
VLTKAHSRDLSRLLPAARWIHAGSISLRALVSPRVGHANASTKAELGFKNGELKGHQVCGHTPYTPFHLRRPCVLERTTAV